MHSGIDSDSKDNQSLNTMHLGQMPLTPSLLELSIANINTWASSVNPAK